MELQFDIRSLIRQARDIHRECPSLIKDDGVVDFVKFGNYVKQRVSAQVGDDFEIKISPSQKHLEKISGVLAVDKNKLTANIIYSKTLNECKKRLTINKELCHLYLDPSLATKTENLATQISQALTIISQHVHLHTLTFNLENSAYILAVEIMLPWEKRAKLNSLKLAEDKTNYDIAAEFGVPEYVIDFYFRTLYGEMSELLNAEIKDQ